MTEFYLYHRPLIPGTSNCAPRGPQMIYVPVKSAFWGAAEITGGVLAELDRCL
jgi:hypothetical protein